MDFSRKNGPCLLSRSILQCLYFPKPCNRFGSTPIMEVLKESARLFSGSPALISKSQLLNNPEVFHGDLSVVIDLIEMIGWFFRWLNASTHFSRFVEMSTMRSECSFRYAVSIKLVNAINWRACWMNLGFSLMR